MGLFLPACASPASAAELAPTLSLKTIRGSRIAFQNGIPVPTFSYQPRRRLDLSGRWRVQPMRLDNDLSLASRPNALKPIVADAGGRDQSNYDATNWPTIDVPGSYNPPPAPGWSGHFPGASSAWGRGDAGAGRPRHPAGDRRPRQSDQARSGQPDPGRRAAARVAANRRRPARP